MRFERWGPLVPWVCLAMIAVCTLLCPVDVSAGEVFQMAPNVIDLPAEPLAVVSPAVDTLDGLAGFDLVAFSRPQMICNGNVCVPAPDSTKVAVATVQTKSVTTTVHRSVYFGARLPRARAVLQRLARPLQSLQALAEAFRGRPRLLSRRC